MSTSAQNHRKVRCSRGHLLANGNLYITPNGRRQCRTCRNLRDRKRRQERDRQTPDGRATQSEPYPYVWWWYKRLGDRKGLAEAGRYTFSEAARITVDHVPPGEEVAMGPASAAIFAAERQKGEG